MEYKGQIRSFLQLKKDGKAPAKNDAAHGEYPYHYILRAIFHTAAKIKGYREEVGVLVKLRHWLTGYPGLWGGD